MVCAQLENESNSQNVNTSKTIVRFMDGCFLVRIGVISRYERYAEDSYKKNT